VLELYLIRHGIAAERGPQYPDDTKRPLTAEGISAMKKVVRGLDELGVGFDLILTSPLVRTRQTADIVAGSRGKPRVQNSNALTPSGTSAAVIEELAKHKHKRRVALVGHEPNIGELAARLIGAASPLPFKKGAVCRIDLESLPPGGVGELRWFMPPRVLRRLA
jgi:phosphohistidine phosphatase